MTSKEKRGAHAALPLVGQISLISPVKFNDYRNSELRKRRSNVHFYGTLSRARATPPPQRKRIAVAVLSLTMVAGTFYYGISQCAHRLNGQSSTSPGLLPWPSLRPDDSCVGEVATGLSRPRYKSACVCAFVYVTVSCLRNSTIVVNIIII